MTIEAKGQPDMTLVPNYALGAGTAALIFAAILSAVLLYVIRPRKDSQTLLDLLFLARFGLAATAAFGGIGAATLLVVSIRAGW